LFDQWYKSMYSTATKLLDRARDASAVRPELTATDLLALVSGAALTGADMAHAQWLIRLLRTGVSRRTRTAPSANRDGAASAIRLSQPSTAP
jgi:hypothetical protein